MTKEKAITIIESHKAHWQRLLRAEICDETEGRETIEGFDMAISALSENKHFDGMTNGEVIRAIFPNISVYEHGSTYSVNNEYNFNATWWNTPYEKECIKTLPTVEKESCRCNTCVNNDDELSGECYECLKGMFDHYEKNGGRKWTNE